MTRYHNIVILTGVGLSAESGLGTFRDVDGIWSQYDLNDVATPDGFARNPKLVLDFYNARRENARGASPNAGHKALARLERDYPCLLYTSPSPRDRQKSRMPSSA